jgi:hypothetical protein
VLTNPKVSTRLWSDWWLWGTLLTACGSWTGAGTQGPRINSFFILPKVCYICRVGAAASAVLVPAVCWPVQNRLREAGVIIIGQVEGALMGAMTSAARPASLTLTTFGDGVAAGARRRRIQTSQALE